MTSFLDKAWTDAQRTAIAIEGRDILVTAGAGTGKTSVLVARILRKLRDQSARDLDRLLVVTFTEKAAAEMRERIYAALAHDPELRRFLPQLPRAPISTIHAFCARLLREQFLLAKVEPGFRILDEQGSIEALEESLRKTFHRWYARNDEAGAEFQRLVELAGFTEEGEALRSIVRRLYQYARSTTDPEAYLDSLVERDAAGSLEDLPWYGDFVDGLAEEWADALGLYAQAVRIAEDAGFDVEKQRACLDCLSSFDPRGFADGDLRAGFVARLRSAGILDEKNRIKVPKAPNGAAKDPAFGICHDTAKKIFAESKLIPRLFGSTAMLLEEDRFLLGSLRALVELVREMSETYERYKERAGLLDYSDLEVRAARLLRDHGLELGMAERFDEVLVDEYQDVNPLQERILSAVSRPGNRFRVGDVKQSIYRFRLADPGIFLEQSRRAIPIRGDASIPDGSEPVAIFLNENHRSRPEVLRFVNRVFGDLFDAETIGSPYADQALMPSRASDASDPLVEFHWIDPSEPKEEADLEPLDLRELQPRLVARRLRALTDDPILRDPEGNLDWSRVAVLLRARTHASYYVDALAREGIPAQIGDGGSLLDEPSVRDLVMLLRAIDNPRDDVTIAAALRSPLFSIGDADLLRIRLAFPEASSYLDAVVGAAFLADRTLFPGVDGGDASESTSESENLSAAMRALLPSLLPPPTTLDWTDAMQGWGARGAGAATPTASALRGALREWCGKPRANAAAIVPPELRRRLQAILLRLAGWRSSVEERELCRFLQELIHDTDLQAAISGSGGGAHPRACLEKLLDLARAYEMERGPSLRGFLNRLGALELTGGIDSVPVAAEGVRILTVHKSKGLEFPIVVVPQLDWRFNGKDRLASRIRIGPRYAGMRRFDPAAYARMDGLARQTLEYVQVREAREEEARILYVAMTRARERLILVAASSVKRETVDDSDCRKTLAKRAWQTASWVTQAFPWSADGIGRRSLLSAMRIREDAPRGRDPREMEFADLSTLVTIIPKECLTEPQTLLLEAVHDDARKATGELLGAVRGDTREATGGELLEASTSDGSTENDREPTNPVEAGVMQRGELEFTELTPLLERMAKLPPRPPLARVEGLRGKYWVTEFSHLGDGTRIADLREEAAALWIPSLFDPPDTEGEARVGLREDPQSAQLSFDLRPPETSSGDRTESRGSSVVGDAPPAKAGDSNAAESGSIVPGISDVLQRAIDASESASERGVRYHMALARLDLTTLQDENSVRTQVARELNRLKSESWWGDGPSDPKTETGIARFLETDLGRALTLASKSGSVEREVPFSLKWSVAELVRHRPELLTPDSIDPRWTRAQWDDALDRYWVLLQGRIDCLFRSSTGWTLLDWKSDRVPAGTEHERALRYRSQIDLYADAVAKLWGEPVRAYVVFLATGTPVELTTRRASVVR